MFHAANGSIHMLKLNNKTFHRYVPLQRHVTQQHYGTEMEFVTSWEMEDLIREGLEPK